MLEIRFLQGVVVAGPWTVGHVGREGSRRCRQTTGRSPPIKRTATAGFENLANIVERAYSTVPDEKWLTEAPVSAMGFGFCKQREEPREPEPAERSQTAHRRWRPEGRRCHGSGDERPQLVPCHSDDAARGREGEAGIPPWCGPRWRPRTAPIQPRTEHAQIGVSGLSSQCERRHELRHDRTLAQARSPSTIGWPCAATGSRYASASTRSYLCERSG